MNASFNLPPGCLPSDIDPPERDEDSEFDMELDDADFKNELNYNYEKENNV